MYVAILNRLRSYLDNLGAMNSSVCDVWSHVRGLTCCLPRLNNIRGKASECFDWTIGITIWHSDTPMVEDASIKKWRATAFYRQLLCPLIKATSSQPYLRGWHDLITVDTPTKFHRQLLCPLIKATSSQPYIRGWHDLIEQHGTISYKHTLRNSEVN